MYTFSLSFEQSSIGSREGGVNGWVARPFTRINWACESREQGNGRSLVCSSACADLTFFRPIMAAGK